MLQLSSWLPIRILPLADIWTCVSVKLVWEERPRAPLLTSGDIPTGPAPPSPTHSRVIEKSTECRYRFRDGAASTGSITFIHPGEAEQSREPTGSLLLSD